MCASSRAAAFPVFNPRSRTYSSVTRRPVTFPYCAHAASTRSSGYLRATGINSARCFWNGELSESANRTCTAALASFSIPGTMPQLEIAIRRAPSPKRSGSVSVATALSTFGKFNNGSPMPMNTVLVIRPSARDISSACNIISPHERLRANPMEAVAQNVQPMAQPTCEERQTM